MNYYMNKTAFILYLELDLWELSKLKKKMRRYEFLCRFSSCFQNKKNEYYKKYRIMCKKLETKYTINPKYYKEVFNVDVSDDWYTNNI